MKTDHCRTCGALVIWAVTAKGKAMPVDAESRSDGNLELDQSDPPRATVVAANQPTLTGLLRYVSHFATCRFAAEHRQRRG